MGPSGLRKTQLNFLSFLHLTEKEPRGEKGNAHVSRALTVAFQEELG